ncbi:MAG: acyl-CoA/acyl-ACP dehydrogenase [Deltaproteobacteria bacterium]|nr:acyl-CoA/acyl-ACP dehydrogenase [Deltaproteobacteria bacterium]
MFELGDQHRMVQDMFRQWCERELLPKVPSLEKGEPPYDLMRQMLDAFGMRDALRASLKKRLSKMGDDGKPLASGDAKGKEGDELESAMRDPLISFLLVKEMSRISPGYATSFGVSTGLAGFNVMAKGTKRQIEKYGIPLVTLDKVGSWCLSEPGSGSDAFGSMRTTAKKSADGGYVLNGTKTFITNGPFADVFVLYAKLDKGDGNPNKAVHAFILERGMTGLSTGQPFDKMGMQDSPTSEVFLEDVHIPAENLLGEREKDPDAARDDTRQNLGHERSGIPAMCLGIIERCYELSMKYAKERVQFGRPILDFQAVQLKLANMYIHYQNVWNGVMRLAWAAREGKPDLAFTCAQKVYCAKAAVEVAMDSIQIHGGYGYMREYHVEKLARDAKMLELGAGTTDINLLQVVRLERERLT